MRKGDIPPAVLKARALEHISRYSDYIACYTDGSKTDDGAGCAFVCGDAVRCFTLPKHASVFSCELVAILKLLCFIEINPARSYVILSDSLSGLQSLSQFYPSDPLAQEILLRVTALDREGTSVSFCWIPSHVGIHGNERADRAANHAAQYPCSRRFPLPARDFVPAVGSFLLGKWQEAWSQSHGNKLLRIKPGLATWLSASRRSRREEVVLCRLRTGHTYGTHGFLIGVGSRPICTRCGDRLSVRHVLVECPRLDAERLRFFGLRGPQLSLRTLLRDDSPFLDSFRLFSFITASGLQVIFNPRL